jgi:hypothetical protein
VFNDHGRQKILRHRCHLVSQRRNRLIVVAVELVDEIAHLALAVRVAAMSDVGVSGADIRFVGNPVAGDSCEPLATVIEGVGNDA